MTEALKSVVAFGFEKVGFHRIQAVVAVENTASIKSLKKAGFTEEGILRQYAMGKEFRDVSMLSFLRDDYESIHFTIYFEEAIRGKTRKESISKKMI
ncbi:GNAT family N-acetyltransferase [Paenibacillus sp. Marseille-Q9583]